MQHRAEPSAAAAAAVTTLVPTLPVAAATIIIPPAKKSPEAEAAPSAGAIAYCVRGLELSPGAVFQRSLQAAYNAATAATASRDTKSSADRTPHAYRLSIDVSVEFGRAAAAQLTTRYQKTRSGVYQSIPAAGSPRVDSVATTTAAAASAGSFVPTDFDHFNLSELLSSAAFLCSHFPFLSAEQYAIVLASVLLAPPPPTSIDTSLLAMRRRSSAAPPPAAATGAPNAAAGPDTKSLPAAAAAVDAAATADSHLPSIVDECANPIPRATGVTIAVRTIRCESTANAVVDTYTLRRTAAQPHPNPAAVVPATSNSTSTASVPACLYTHEVNKWGQVDILYEDAPTAGTVGLYRLNIAPERRIPWHYHVVMNESELIQTDALLCNDTLPPPSATVARKAALSGSTNSVPVGGLFPIPVRASIAARGATHSWAHGVNHTYYNPSTRVLQPVLCIDVPAFLPSDELIVAPANGTRVCSNKIDDDDCGASTLPPALNGAIATANGVHSNGATAGSSALPVTAAPPTASIPDLFWLNYSRERAASASATNATAIGSPPLVFDFPGGYERQSISLSFDRASFMAVEPDAVQIIAFAAAPPAVAGADDRDLSIVLIHHRTRGWELPGGKIERKGGERIESAEAAAVRELAEEAGVRVHANSLQPIAQYAITESESATPAASSSERRAHIKRVFVGTIASVEQPFAFAASNDTDARALKPVAVAPLPATAASSESDPIARIRSILFPAALLSAEPHAAASPASSGKVASSSIWSDAPANDRRLYSGAICDNVFALTLQMALATHRTRPSDDAKPHSL